MTYSPIPPGVAAAPIAGVTIPPSYKSPTSDAPPPAYFPPSRSPSPRPLIYTQPSQTTTSTNSRWTRFPSSSPSRLSMNRTTSPLRTPSEIETRRTRYPSRTPPGYISGQLNPAPKKHRHRSSLRPNPPTSERNDARFPTSDPPPFSTSPSPYRSRSPSPCPPIPTAPSRNPLNVGVETELNTDEERRQQYRPAAKDRYAVLADESDLLIEERGRYAGGGASYGMWGERYSGRMGRRGAVVWGMAVLATVLVVVSVLVVLKARSDGG